MRFHARSKEPCNSFQWDTDRSFNSIGNHFKRHSFPVMSEQPLKKDIIQKIAHNWPTKCKMTEKCRENPIEFDGNFEIVMFLCYRHFYLFPFERPTPPIQPVSFALDLFIIYSYGYRYDPFLLPLAFIFLLSPRSTCQSTTRQHTITISTWNCRTLLVPHALSPNRKTERTGWIKSLRRSLITVNAKPAACNFTEKSLLNQPRHLRFLVIGKWGISQISSLFLRLDKKTFFE